MAEMRICFYTSDIREFGGIGRATRIIAERLVKLGEWVGIVSLTCSEAGAEMPKILTSLHVQFDERVRLRRVFFKCVQNLRAYLKANRIDVLVCTMEMLSPVCAAAVRGLQTKYVCWLHSDADVYNEYGFQRQCRFIAVKSAAAIIAVNDRMAEQLERKYRIHDITCILNPVDERLLSKQIDYKLDSMRIISVGRLSYQKNFELLADVAKLVFERHPEWRWDIYGEGGNRESIERRIEENGLAGRLNLMGAVSNIYERYPEYAMQVMTSRYEGFPMALLEGMACGLPLISFDMASVRRIIRDGKNGFLIMPHDVEGMAERICALIERPELRAEMSVQNELYRHEFDVGRITENWLKLLVRVKHDA
ncbi:MAG: glycosyltransferase [Christensenellaceae bacterium]|nr:glycosyltransferase [Christensenellaceae bacterium]